MILLAVFVLFARSMVIEPLLEHAEKMGEKINAFEPMIAMGNSGFLLMLIPMLFLVLLGDFPVIESNSLFYISRSGKTNWLLGQILFAVLAVISCIGVIFGTSVLFSGGTFQSGWSNVVTKYATYYPEEAESFACKMLPDNLFHQVTVQAALIHTLIFNFLYMLMLSLVLCLGKVMQKKHAGFFCCLGLMGCGMITISTGKSVMWFFPMAHTIVWLHYQELYRKQTFPVGLSYVIFCCIIGLLVGVNLILVRKMKINAQS